MAKETGQEDGNTQDSDMAESVQPEWCVRCKVYVTDDLICPYCEEDFNETN